MADIDCFYFEEVMEELEPIYICHSSFPGRECDDCESCPANPLVITEDGEELLRSLLV